MLYCPGILVFIIDRANLSHAYFTSRVDRYFVIHCEKLSSYLHRFTEIYEKFCNDYDFEAFESNICTLNNTSSIPEFDLEPGATICFPIISIPGIQSYNLMSLYGALLSSNLPNATVLTPYFNIPNELIESSSSALSIVIPSSDSHCSKNLPDYSTSVTSVYDYIASKFSLDYPSHKLLCFKNDQKTFHAKGFVSSSKEMTVTTIGSCNINYRSFYIDSELDFLLISRNDELYKQQSQVHTVD